MITAICFSKFCDMLDKSVGILSEIQTQSMVFVGKFYRVIKIAHLLKK